MDPSIMKILEDDEDESMHSGADLEAFTAALNRDIGRDDADISRPPDSAAGALSQESSSTSIQLLGQWQSSNQNVNPIQQNTEQTEKHHLQFQEQHASEVGQVKQQSDVANLQEETSSQPEQEQPYSEQQQQQEQTQQGQQQIESDNTKIVEKNQVHHTEQNPAMSQEENSTQKSENQQQHPTKQFSNQQAQSSDQANNPMKRMKFSSISFYALIPVLRPHLDKDRYMQLNDVFSKLKSNEISREDFLRVIRNTVGDQMLRQAVHKVMQQQAQTLAARNSPVIQNPQQVQTQTSLPQLPARGIQLPEQQSFSHVRAVSSAQHQIGQRMLPGQSENPTSTVKVQNDSSSLVAENNGRNPKVMESPSDGQVMHATQISSTNMISVKQERESSLQGINRQQNHLQMPSTSFAMHRPTTSSYITHQFPRPSGSGSATSLKPQSKDSQQRQMPLPQGVLSSQSGATRSINVMNTSSLSDTKRFQSSSLSPFSSHSAVQENQLAWQPSSAKEQRGSGSSSMVYVKQEALEQAAELHNGPQLSTPQSSSVVAMDVDQVNSASSSGKDEQIEKQLSRVAFHTSTSMMSASNMTGPTAFSSEQAMQMRSQIHSTSSPALAGPSVKTPSKKSSVGQKKPLETQGIPPLASKKQKVSGAFQDQSIEQLNDVTAVSGVNLREEEEQLLTAPKEESRASEATRRALQEEEERLIVQRRPLQKKIAEIMSKCGIENFSTDVERCLSMCVEERLRGFISNLIRLSKQRVDVEKPRHQIVFTSDVRREVLAINRKAKEDLDKKQAEEAEKTRKVTENEGNTGADGEKDKDEGRSKVPKANKDEDDKMRTTAANVAARAAVGGDDMLSKWQLMAEQARQKREGGGLDGISASQPGRAAVRKQNSGKTSRDSHADKKGGGASSGTLRKFGSPTIMPHVKVARNICTKDVISVLQREPQMSKSTLLYRLFERISGEPVVE